MSKRYLPTQGQPEHSVGLAQQGQLGPAQQGPQHSLGPAQQGRPVLCRHLRLPRLEVGGEGGGGVRDHL